MNRIELEGDWLRTKGRIREKWGELMDDDMEKTKGKAEQMVGILKKESLKAKERPGLEPM